MIPAPFPENESKRLASIQALNILDTPAEERFDRVTRIARRMFDVPFSVVTVVDANRQWFKSCIGIDVQETPREISFCAHAILNNEIMVIEDTFQDPRFVDNPLVSEEPHVRFYAGRPLKLPSIGGEDAGYLGTLCILDSKPRQMSADDLELLDDLASMVESELSAHYAATTDDLTLISNRRGFQILGQKALNYCQRYQHQACLAFIDLNDFKPINDTYGHGEGDKALVQFAEMLLNCSRDSDIVARLGGDEFVMLLMNTDVDGAESVMANIQKQLESYNQASDKGYELHFSCGLVEFDQHKDIDALLEDGDSLMYQCKQENINR